MGPPRSRATGKKSRNGCKTCKIRRVKCDESKPLCLRDNRGPFFTILPKKQAAVLAPSPAPTKTFKIVLEPQPASSFSDQESRYFNYFRQSTASCLAEYLDTKLWNCIVLQATEQTLPVKHSVIALGALHKTLQEDPCPHSTDGNLQQNPHYRFALQQYGKSLKLTRAACTATAIDTRTLLISCFLSICFEGIHGSTDAAVAHIKSGLSILNEFCGKESKKISTAERQLLPGVLEDEIISVLARLDTDLTSLVEIEPVVMHPKVQIVVREVFRCMPSDQFESLTSARKYLDLLLREVGIFVTSSNEQHWNPILPRESFIDPDSGLYVDLHPDPETCLRPTLVQQADRAGFLDCLEKWQHTFLSLTKSACAQQTPDAGLATTALNLRVICASVSLKCCFGPEITYDAFIPEFEMALQLAQTLHASGPSSKGPRPTFITSSILIRSLYFIAIKCRVLRVRVGALRILEGMKRREGIWDAGFVSGVIKCVVAIEEGWEGDDGEKADWYEEYVGEETDAELPPESRRITSLKTSFDVYKRIGNIRFFQTVNGDDGATFLVGKRDIMW
ncbi:hypothetical protein VTL71DRAFT_14175 [Oculimacula yallundae]|uniref:Zn(2)-C6 fungal-type domain-containing protein n=1 Tax=Oculimacula yallundae TaxID=86028 RepID=A0ABR4CJT3_9HELO